MVDACFNPSLSHRITLYTYHWGKMAIELYFSNRIESLVEHLSDNLSEEIIGKKNKFDPSVVIVPNQNMIKWLQLTLAALQGILLQVRFDFIENGLWYLLTELDVNRTSVRLMDYKTRTLRLVYYLNRLDLKKYPELDPIAGYLLDSDGRRKIDFAPRLWQLSQRLSILFQEYEYHRPGMLNAWLEGQTTDNPLECCQRFLYRKVYPQTRDDGFPSGVNYSSLLEHAARIIKTKPSPGKVQPRVIHIFGMSQISSLHLQLLRQLALFHSIYIYTLNPSQEFWEDAQSQEEQRWFKRKGIASETSWTQADMGGIDSNAQIHPLLAAWGKQGRENVRQLCDLTDYTFHDCYKTPKDRSTLLHRIQCDIITLDVNETQTALQDTSLQIFASHSRFREVETVYNTICYNLKRHDGLKLTDIAVLVPDMELYKPIFDTVFNRSPKMLNYNLVDSNAQLESLYGQAVIQILQLVQGRFTRKEVFELLLNPCFMQRWDIQLEEVQDWVDWADELNIFHKFSRRDDMAQASMPTERFSWKQALQRLRLGRIMAPAEPGISMKIDFQDVVPFTNLAASNLDALEKFCMVVETLHHHVRTLSNLHGPRQRWVELFTEVCDALIQVPQNYRGEEAVQYELFQAMEELAPPEIENSNPLEDEWDIEIFLEYVRFVLTGISGGRGDYLTGGVTISALQPMRPIPFKIIFIIGMEEGRFPGREVPLALDLRQNDRRREDVALAERNCYLFLELLLSTRQKLYLGYVARDIKKDREMQPCSVINQLRQYITFALLADGDEFKVQHIPLKGNDPRYLDPDRITDWSDVMSNFFLADRVSLFRSRNHWSDFLEHASETELNRIQPLTPVLNTSQTPVKGTDTRKMVVTNRQLAHFLIDPVKQNAQAHLGLYGPEASIEDLAMKEDEPFYSVFPVDYTIQMECLRLWVNLNFIISDSSKPPNERTPGFLLERIYTAYEKQSAAPEGVFGSLDRQAMLERIEGTVEVMTELTDAAQDSTMHYHTISLGMDETAGGILFKAETGISHPALELISASVGPHGGQQQLLAEIHAVLNWVWQDRNTSDWHMLVLTGSKQSTSNYNRYLLAPLLAYLVCVCKDPSDVKMAGFPIYFHLVYESKIQNFKCRIGSEQAMAVLKNLLEAYGNQKDFHWLPFEKVLKCKNGPRHHCPASATDFHRQEFADEMAAHFEELDDYLIQRLAMPISTELFDVADKRFGWIFEVIEKV